MQAMNRRKRPSRAEQVREGLLADIVAGKLEPGAKLANENELAERFDVSRATVRDAVLGLIDAGYLDRRHGSGTYVTYAPRTRHPLETTVSYTAMIRESGHKPSETVVSKGVRSPAEFERKRLELSKEEQVVEVERVRLAGRRPVIYSRDCIPMALLGDRTDDALDSSLYVILEGAGHAVARASAQLIPTLATAKLAKLLAVKRGAPLLHIDQVDYDERGRAVMLSHEWHVADAFELIVNRRASPAADET
jgi:GntR family transcriptional regulator